MATLILLNKPFNTLSQFTDAEGRNTLAPLVSCPGVYPAGRLDYDSEGLLLLTDNGSLQQRIASPRQKMHKHYWVQVEGDISDEALARLEAGVQLKDGLTLPARARRIQPPDVWPRVPPVRERQTVPTCWIELVIREGRNRQVRRMTAAAGFPTLRLIRHRIGDWTLDGLQPGQWRSLTVHLPSGSNDRAPQRQPGKTRGPRQPQKARQPRQRRSTST